MQHLSCVRSSAGRRRRVWIALVVLLVVVASLLTAAIAIAGSHRIVDADATPNFSANINGSGASVDAAMSVVADGTGAYVAGWAGNAAGNADATLARVTSRGAVKWLKRYDSPAHKGDAFARIVKGPKRHRLRRRVDHGRQQQDEPPGREVVQQRRQGVDEDL